MSRDQKIFKKKKVITSRKTFGKAEIGRFKNKKQKKNKAEIQTNIGKQAEK